MDSRNQNEQSMNTSLSFKERCERAIRNRNFIEAFAIAQHYKTLFLQNYLIKTEGEKRREVNSMGISALEWLATGLEFIKESNSFKRRKYCYRW